MINDRGQGIVRISIEEYHYDNNFSKKCYESICESDLWSFHVRMVSITLVNLAFNVPRKGGGGVGFRVYSLRGGGRKEFVIFISRFDSIHLKLRCSPVRQSCGKYKGGVTCTMKRLLVQGLHQAKLDRPVATCAKFLRISLKLIEFFSARFLLYQW